MKKFLNYPNIAKFKADLDKCTRCGFCMSACPVYREEKVESSVARGKVVMVRNLLSGGLDTSKEMGKQLNRCTLCSTCTQNCPAGADVPAVITAARADKTARRGIPFLYTFIYRWLLPRRRLFGNTVRFISWFQGIFLPKTNGTTRHLAFFLSALGKGRHIPNIAPKFLRDAIPVVNEPPSGMAVKMTVGYFTGCMTDFVFPELGIKIVKFLTTHGVRVIVPREQGCCGAPVFLGAGDFVTGRKMADANAAAFKTTDYIITDCATCASAMKDYKKFLADTGERQQVYAELNDKVKDITEFLVDILKLPPSAYHAAPEYTGKTVTYHEPCHLGKHLGVKDQPRFILKSIPEIKYIEMPEAGRCCGMAGAFSIYYYELSKNIADKKAESIASTGADVVVTDCPGCQVQIIDTLTRRGLPHQVRHLMEILK